MYYNVTSKKIQMILSITFINACNIANEIEKDKEHKSEYKIPSDRHVTKILFESDFVYNLVI